MNESGPLMFCFNMEVDIYCLKYKTIKFEQDW